MDPITVIEDFYIQLNRERIFSGLRLNQNNSAYEEAAEEFERLNAMLPGIVVPRGGFLIEPPGAFMPGAASAGRAYGIVTLGSRASEWSGQFFSRGEYLAGMLADFMMDECLFQADTQLSARIADVCRACGYGGLQNLQIPDDLPFPFQEEIVRRLEAPRRFGIELTEGYMFMPAKTLSSVYAVGPGYGMDNGHDCGRCSREECMFRKEMVLVEAVCGEEVHRLRCEKGANLWELLQKAGVTLSSPCGGKGTCGKCKIQLLAGSLPVTAADERQIKSEELLAGWRLACLACPDEDIRIRVPETEKQIAAVAEFGSRSGSGGEEVCEGTELAGIAVDIGTTTLAFALVDKSGNVIHTVSQINHQSVFGADVIARIQASNEGKADALRACIRQDLCAGIAALLEGGRAQITPEQIPAITIAANTTMVHLLMGYSCQGMGSYPFQPEHTGRITASASAVLGSSVFNCPVTVLPGFTAFVGGDILAGMLAAEMDISAETVLFLDLGTNAEMAIGHKGKFLVGSAAAGPAFEGGNLSCGCPSIPGAVHTAVMKAGRMITGTIGQKPPIGICGTGVVDVIAELVRNHMVDETGVLHPMMEEGVLLGRASSGTELFLTQKDIREIQLAKAAVRAGVDCLIQECGVEMSDISHVYLAGGFGYHLKVINAVRIGLLPDELADRVQAVGNASLQGAKVFLNEPGAAERAEVLRTDTEEVILAKHPAFSDAYMRHMYFEE